MPARANVVINDRAATPVAHTFVPDGEDANGVSLFSEKTGVPAGDSRFTAALRNSNGKYRPSLRLQIPVVQTQTINGVSSPVVVRTAYVELNCTFDALSTLQERKDAIGLMANALSSAQTMVNAMLTELSPIY
jgi:vacuolar-type H+-ATPase subunit D/Vma8